MISSYHSNDKHNTSRENLAALEHNIAMYTC